ncbi:MAG: maltose alpha-D-glucosyltransferase, partial [Thermoplasmata archaeon]
LETLLERLSRWRPRTSAGRTALFVRGHADRLLARTASIRRARREGLEKIRVHGDLHLGQLLVTPRGYVVLDFEGEPARPLSERRGKRIALKDVGGLLRSFDYAAHSALASGPRADDRAAVAAARRWSRAAAVTFLEGYRRRISAGSGPRRLLPRDPSSLEELTRFFELEKAVYEVRYELDHRPDWVEVPLRALADLAGAPSDGSS